MTEALRHYPPTTNKSKSGLISVRTNSSRKRRKGETLSALKSSYSTNNNNNRVIQKAASSPSKLCTMIPGEEHFCKMLFEENQQR